MNKKIIAGFILYTVFSFQLIASEDRAMFWRVDSAQATVYLLGSIHFADSSFYPLRAEIEQAFAAAQTLVVEVDMDSPESSARLQHFMQKEALYTGEETLRDNLSEATYNELQAYLKTLGIPLALVEKQKPGVVVLTLAAIQAEQAGLKSELGIDQHFLNKVEDKNLLAMETMDEQLTLFLNIENTDLLFQDLFYSQEILESEMNNLISAWKQGDEDRMHKLLFEDVLNENAAINALYEQLYFQRNIKMAASIEDYLSRKGGYFVVVGAGHLLGDRGIVQLLIDAGYRVTRL